MATYQIPAPSPMCMTGDVAEHWKEFEIAWNDYLTATELDQKMKKPDGTPNAKGIAIVAATLCSVMGPECKRILTNLPDVTEADRRDPQKITDALKKYFVPQRNVLYERFVFNSAVQKTGESIDQFVLRLRQLAESCEFEGLKDSLIRDRIVIGTNDEAGRERLLRERPIPNLNRVIENLRAAEVSRTHKQVISGKSETPVEFVRRQTHHKPGRREHGSRKPKDKGRPHKQKDRKGPNGQHGNSSEKCKWCAKPRDHARKDCPAKDSKCHKCGKMGHFANACLSTSTNEISEGAYDSDHDVFLGEVHDVSDDFWSVNSQVNGHHTQFKLDSGSKITVIGEKTPWLTDENIEKCPPSGPFKGAGGVPLSHLIKGVIKNATIQVKDRKRTETVYIMEGQTKNLLSIKACRAMNLLVPDPLVFGIDTTNFRREYPRLFRGLGLLKDPYKIVLREDAEPVCIYTARRVAHPLLPKVKEQLESMVKMGVVSPVEQPTEWCSGMVVVPKPNGKVRICVDLTPLNKAVKREVHPMATVDENLAKIQGSRVFTKLDANSGFWQIPLHPSSRLLTTFVTPYGRFCFNRLPFGISSAPEVFQRTMSNILCGMEGVICHMDDILVHGPDQDTHDQRVRRVLSRLQEAGITLNEKCEFAKQEIAFLGHIISQQGITADPGKTKAIRELPAPTNVTELQRFNGMVNQLAKFLPDLAKINEPLRQLLRKDQQWRWDTPQDRAFNVIKEKLSSTETLAHYNPNRPSIIAADACQYGIGAVLLQEDDTGYRRPVSYASRSLNDTEKRYAVIEKEALAATWACEKFSAYVLGSNFTLETDHRPLVPLLSSTDLTKLPARVLRFRLRLMRYSPEVKYVQGVNQKTADALSRAPTSNPTKDDLILVEEVEELKNVVLGTLPTTDQRLQEILEAQRNDAVCTQVRTYVTEGWPSVMPNLPLLKPYWSNQHRLTVCNDLLMFDKRIVIPQALQLDILEQIHTGHLGITKCKGRAHNSVWWPSITSQVEAMCNRCVTCRLCAPERMEPLMSLSTPSAHWERVATDLFQFNKKEYLVVVDYSSRWLDFKQLTSTSSQAVIDVLSEIFANHGIPLTVISDNGPQFSSSEFRKFSETWGFTHVTSSPRYPQANGAAERAVQTAKNILKKNDNPYLGLLAYRTAPVRNGKTPSQLLMSRLLHTRLPTVPDNLKPQLVDQEEFSDQEQKYKNKYSHDFNRRHNVVSLPCLTPGDKVFVRDQGCHGEVLTKLNNPRSYRVETDNGSVIRRNRRSLIHTGISGESPTMDAPLLEAHQSPEVATTPNPVSQPSQTSQPSTTAVTQPTCRRSGRISKSTQRPEMVYY